MCRRRMQRKKEVSEEMQNIGTLGPATQQEALRKALLLGKILDDVKRSLPISREDINASTKNDAIQEAKTQFSKKYPSWSERNLTVVSVSEV